MEFHLKNKTKDAPANQLLKSPSYYTIDLSSTLFNSVFVYACGINFGFVFCFSIFIFCSERYMLYIYLYQADALVRFKINNNECHIIHTVSLVLYIIAKQSTKRKNKKLLHQLETQINC